MAFNLEKLAYGHTVDTSQILCNPTVVITFLKKSLVQIRGKYVTSPFSFLFRPTGNRAIRDSAAASRAAPAPLHHISAQLPKKPYKKKKLPNQETPDSGRLSLPIPGKEETKVPAHFRLPIFRHWRRIGALISWVARDDDD